MEAAQDHSGVNDPFGQNILVSIGRFITADTKTGWVSDRRAAEVAKCDKGTIAAWRERFLTMGIIETWTTGAGRGTKRWYKFLFPFDDAKHEPVINGNKNGETSGPEPDNNHPDINQRMTGLEKLMSEMRDLLTGLPELMSGINVWNDRPRPVQDHHSTKEEHHDHRGRSPARAREAPHPNVPWPETDTQKWQATHQATWTWCEAGFNFPGYDNIGAIIEKLGEKPDLDALVKARRMWTMSDYRPGNYLGILDWYDQLQADPTWEPSRRFSKNGHSRAGEDQQKDKDQELEEKLQREGLA